jgi:hypothetical protein
MTAITRKAKLTIIFGAIALAVGIGITLAMVYSQTLVGMFQQVASQDDDDDNDNPGYDTRFGFTAKYKTALAVGEEGTFGGTARHGQEPYTFEWKFSDGVTQTGQIITRSFSSSGSYNFDVTVTDAEGKKVKSGTMSINVLQEMPKEEEGGTANATSIQHN